ncbi:MAG: winged helix-turn-helix domain-containing protein [Candidatus Bathyarchaeota archaeon]|jgi:DNA-binding transcriptional ArsR family regulator|nr:winged helix-turn-helix domain-containing protein [Candidatus Bathyarchaeota archaeon]
MVEKESETLKGTALDIYRLLLKANKPLGIREIQRILKLSSPSIAQHHLARLEEACLVKREWGDYVINRVELQNCVKISSFLIPRHFFYLIFAVGVLALELVVLEPIFTLAYAISVVAALVFIVIFGYETIKVWRRGSL